MKIRILVKERTFQHIMMKYEAHSLKLVFTTLCCMQANISVYLFLTLRYIDNLKVIKGVN